MTVYTYNLKVAIEVHSEDNDREPAKFVRSAVETLLQDNWDEWLDEAIGYSGDNAIIKVTHL